MTFNDITGHGRIKKMLEDLVQNGRVSHAYIFCGEKGVGKRSAALAWANMITDGSIADVTVVTNETYADSVKKTSKSSALSVDTVRAARDDMYLKPYAAQKRVFIIPGGEEMTIPAQNALLKVFEEPPPYCVIIIITDNSDALLQTIRSRAVTVRFGALSDGEIAQILEKNGCKPTPLICALANGSASMAQTFAQDDEKLTAAKETIRLLNAFITGKAKQKYDLISFLQKNRANYNIILNTFTLFFEQSLLQLCGKNVTIPTEVSLGETASCCITAAEDCKRALKSNVNYNMAVSELVCEIDSILTEGCNR